MGFGRDSSVIGGSLFLCFIFLVVFVIPRNLKALAFLVFHLKPTERSLLSCSEILPISIMKVLAYAQQSRERSNYEHAALIERVQEFKRQIDQESEWSPNGLKDSSNVDGMQAIARSSHKMIEAVMQSAAEGKVQTICQGYLSMVRKQKDQLFVARAYYPSLAKLHGQQNLSHELKQNMQEHEHMLSDALLFIYRELWTYMI